MMYFSIWGGAVDRNCENSICITHIEPYPKILKQIFGEFNSLDLHQNRLQEIPISLFERLEANDILFIDSTHIAKVNSDVNKIVFDILPALKKGVFIHFHDIFYPFNYPQEWLKEKRAWNESYILRAFLQYNENFEIVFFNTCLNHFYPSEFAKTLPLSQKNTGGSIWIKKIK